MDEKIKKIMRKSRKLEDWKAAGLQNCKNCADLWDCGNQSKLPGCPQSFPRELQGPRLTPTLGRCQPWSLEFPGKALWAPWELVLVPTILQIRPILAILQSCSCPILQSSRFSCHFLNLFIQSFQILQSCNPPNIQSSKLGTAECA